MKLFRFEDTHQNGRDGSMCHGNKALQRGRRRRGTSLRGQQETDRGGTVDLCGRWNFFTVRSSQRQNLVVRVRLMALGGARGFCCLLFVGLLLVRQSHRDRQLERARQERQGAHCSRRCEQRRGARVVLETTSDLFRLIDVRLQSFGRQRTTCSTDQRDGKSNHGYVWNAREDHEDHVASGHAAVQEANGARLDLIDHGTKAHGDIVRIGDLGQRSSFSKGFDCHESILSNRSRWKCHFGLEPLVSAPLFLLVFFLVFFLVLFLFGCLGTLQRCSGW